MKFWEAMKALDEGKRVRCLDWPSHQYIFYPMWCRESFPVVIYEDIAKKWEFYEEPEKTYTFMEVVQGLKEGKKFKRSEWQMSPLILRENGLVDRLAPFNYLFSVEDFEATDWIEVK